MPIHLMSAEKNNTTAPVNAFSSQKVDKSFNNSQRQPAYFQAGYNPYYVDNNMHYYCMGCYHLQNEINHLNMKIDFINKNCELLTGQIKLLETKLTLSTKMNDSTQNNSHKYNNNYKHNTNYAGKYHKFENNGNSNTNKPATTVTENKKNPIEKRDEAPIIIRIDDSDFENKLNKNPVDAKNDTDMPIDNPLGLLGLFGSLFSTLENKNKSKITTKSNKTTINSANDSDSDSDVDSTNEINNILAESNIEELNFEIKTIDDLIKLGNEYLTSNKSEPKDGNKKKSSEPVSSNPTTASNVEKKYSEYDTIKKLVANSLNSYKPEPKDENENKASESINKDSDKDVDKKKEYDRNDYMMNGKMYPINLKTLSKLVKPLLNLKKMIGINDVKNSIVDMILYYLQNFEKKNKNMLHTVIEGPPGVGKTRFAKILADVYAALGVIPTNKFTIAKRPDLIGEFVGHTSVKTQKVFDEAKGGVLFIDEVYSLGHEEKKDNFSKECIDMINQNLSENKNDLIVIIAGYTDQINKCFFAYNEGLRRRFPFKFSIEGYSPEELRDIFIQQVKDIKWKLDDNIELNKLTHFFVTNKNDFNEYAGSIENLLLHCKMSHSRRVYGKHPSNRKNISFLDIENGFNRYVSNKKKDNSIIQFKSLSMYS